MTRALRILWIACALLLQAQRASAQSDQEKTSRTWKSTDGKIAVRVDETVFAHHADGSRGTIRTQNSQVIGLAVAADGTTTELWQWVEKPPGGSYIPLEVAEVVVGESHKRFVLVGRSTGLPPTGFQRIITFLDASGKAQMSINADKWWKAVGAEGKIGDHPPKCRLLNDEKVLEITLESGTRVQLNSDTAEITVVKVAATAPATAPVRP